MTYFSKYTSRQVRPAQKIVEIMCERFFGKDGIVLPQKFWNDKRYARHYKLELIRVNGLLKIYSAEAVIAALQSKKGSTVWSLGAKWLDAIISAEESKLKLLASRKEEYAKQKAKEETVKTGLEDSIQGKIVDPKLSKSLFDKLDGDK